MVSDSFLYSSDDAMMMSVQEHRLWSEAGLSVGTSLAFATECGLTFP